MARFSLSPPASSVRSRQQQQQQHHAQGQTPPSSSTAAHKASTTPTTTTPQWKWEFPPQDRYYRSPLTPRENQNDIRNNGNPNRWSEDDDDDGSSTTSSSSEESEESDSTGQHEIDFDEYSNSNNSNDSDNVSESELEEEEPPHPLGFESRYGRTRFGLSPKSTNDMNRNSNRPPRDIFDRDDEYAWNALIRIDDDDDDDLHKKYGRRRSNKINHHHPANEQSFPPIGGSYHLSHGTVSTRQLLNNRKHYDDDDGDDNDAGMNELLSGMDRIANLVKAAGHVGIDNNNRNQFASPGAPSSQQLSFASPHARPRSTSKLLQLASACEHQQKSLQNAMSQSSQQRKTAYQQSCRGFLLLLQADASRASSADERIAERQHKLEEMEEKERLEQVALEEELRQQRREAEKVEADRVAAQEARSEEGRIKEIQKQQQLKEAEKEAEEEANKKNAHVDRATSLIANLEEVRSGIVKEFDKSKSVGRRRLQFKKIVNGKINTLSHDERKVCEVGKLVVDAVANAANDDSAAAASGGAEPVQTAGKKYLLDLLAANLIVRVQADGFNGTRGDGFPLAATFAHVSTQCPELGPVLEGHLYAVCPTAIPTLSLTSAREGEGEDELMESLGMIRDKEGKFESFDKFLNRTEGLISIMADIMSSHPTNHTLLGGHPGALTWLRRFLDLMPAPPAAPLPLLTAPVLVAFLTGAGHMLANKYPTEFGELWNVIEKDLVKRLDESPVGVPSATRLKKVILEVGLGGLRKELPQGSVAGLYDDGKGGSSAGMSSFGQAQSVSQTMPSSAPSTSSFGQMGGSSSSNWGNSMEDAAPADSNNNAASTPFGGGGFGATPAASGASPFGASSGGNQQGFGMTPAAGPAPGQSPFGTNTAPAAPFGAAATGPSPFGAAPAPAPFGAAAPAAPFGTTPAAPGPSPFGAAPAAPSASPFGATAPGPSPFAAAAPAAPFGATAGAPGPSPFGSTAPAASPFGAAPAAPGPSPFGSAAPAATGFGGQQQQPSSGFGGASPFGAAAPAPSPFGGGNNDGGTKKQPCKFFASGKCNFGDRCKFSHEMGGNNPMSGQQQQQQPFNATATFGGGGGGQGNKQPCKFFASGNCRHGDKCRFSHEPQGGGGGGFGGSAATPFGGGGGGGGFGQSSNPSPFGGNAGGFGGSSPFGAAPSNAFGGPRR